MTDDIKLPPLPYPQIPGGDYDPKDMWDYARAAIKAYRQQCGGEPVAYAVFADNGNIRIWQHEPLEWPEAVPLYSAPQPAAPAQEPVAWQYWDGTFWVTTIDPKGHRINGRAVRPLYASPQPAAPAQEPTPSEAVYAFAAWLTTRKHAVTLGSTQDAAIVAELVSLFVASQGWESPRDDYIDHLRAYPSEAPQLTAPVQEPSEDLMNALRNQRQIDRDGTEVGVSRQALDEAIALLAQYGQTTTPKGWKLVPASATKAMQDAWDESPSSEDSDEDFHRAYINMLEAAPKFGEDL